MLGICGQVGWVALMVMADAGFGGDWTVTRLTNDALEQDGPVVLGENVVWRAPVGGYLQLFEYDAGSGLTNQLTFSTQLRDVSAPGSDGQVVAWDALTWDVNGDREVFRYAGTAVDRITNNLDEDSTIVGSAGCVAWLQRAELPFSEQDVDVMLDCGSATVNLTDTNQLDEEQMAIGGSRVAWVLDGQVYLYDTATQVTTQASNGSANHAAPAVSDDLLAWVTGGTQVIAYDPATAVSSTVSSTTDPVTDLQVAGAHALWVTTDGSAQKTLWTYNDATGTTQSVATTSYAACDPYLLDGAAFWTDGVQVFLYDLSAGLTAMVGGPGDVLGTGINSVHAYGDTITWRAIGSGGTDHEIFMAKPAPPNPAPQLVSASSRLAHGAGGSEMDIDLIHPIGSAACPIECRSPGAELLVIDFDQLIQGAGGLDASDVSLAGGTVNGLSIAGAQLRIEMTSTTVPTRVTVGFPGILSLAGTPVSATVAVEFGVVIGDVDGNGVVSVFDLLGVRNNLSQPVTISNFRHDVHRSGGIDIFDLLAVRNALGTSCP